MKPQAASHSVFFVVKGWKETNSLLIFISQFLSGFHNWYQTYKNPLHLAIYFPITPSLQVSLFASIYSFCIIRIPRGCTQSFRLCWGRLICRKMLLFEVLQERLAFSPLSLTSASCHSTVAGNS